LVFQRHPSPNFAWFKAPRAKWTPVYLDFERKPMQEFMSSHIVASNLDRSISLVAKIHFNFGWAKYPRGVWLAIPQEYLNWISP
jgi:hypothetical protein